MRLSYYFDTEMSTREVKKALNFFNDCALDNREGLLIDFYLSTPGGTVDSYMVLRDYMERAPFDINIIVSEYIASAGFLLFYRTENVFKTILPHSSALIHLVSIALEDRNLRNHNSLSFKEKNAVDDMNNEILEYLNNNKALSPLNQKKIKNGGDVMLTYKDFYKMMLKCPYGTLIKENEQIEENK